MRAFHENPDRIYTELTFLTVKARINKSLQKYLFELIDSQSIFFAVLSGKFFLG